MAREERVRRDDRRERCVARLVAQQLAEQVAEQLRCRAAFVQRRQQAGAVRGDEQSAGAAARVAKAAPLPWRELLRTVDVRRLPPSLGGPVAQPMIATALWSLGLTAVFAVPAAIGYRRASRG